MPEIRKTTYLQDLWKAETAEALGGNPLALLRYRSNLLGADLRITNFGGGNTSSKIELSDPFSGKPVRVLAVKGSGGDLGSIKDSGFALLYQDRLEQLRDSTEARRTKTKWWAITRFAHLAKIALRLRSIRRSCAAAFCACGSSASGLGDCACREREWKTQAGEFNREYGRKIVWVPWQRPGFELALLIERAVQENPGIDGILLGGHGLFTWGDTQRDCYLNSIHTIDEMGDFILRHQNKKGTLFGGLERAAPPDRKEIAAQILPALRGALSSERRVIAHYADEEDALNFAGSAWARELSALGTSCPDHFLRTRVCPLFVNWDSRERCALR